jgi:hypothetical protein
MSMPVDDDDDVVGSGVMVTSFIYAPNIFFWREESNPKYRLIYGPKD